MFTRGHPYYPPKSEKAKVKQYTAYKNIKWTPELHKKLSEAVKNSYTPELRELRRKQRLEHPSLTREDARKGGRITGPKRARELRKIALSAGLRARQFEREMIERLRPNFDYVANSSQVCDAVAIKDGKVYLLEFKQTDKRLKPPQARVKELAPEYYRIYE